MRGTIKTWPPTDPCSVEYWHHELAKEDPLLENLDFGDIGFVHATFSKQGNENSHAGDDGRQHRGHNRTEEIKYSAACLRKALPLIQYQHVDLGDFASYVSGMAAFHAWAAHESPYSGNFVIDTDLFANPHSDLSPQVLTWSLQNVDMAFNYNQNRRISDMSTLQGQDGIQGAFFGFRNNRRTRLFHSCVQHILSNNTNDPPMRQQKAINTVLTSPVGQFLRVRLLPPEFFCWDDKVLKNASSLSAGFSILEGVVLHSDTQCLFVHSHILATRKQELLQVCF